MEAVKQHPIVVVMGETGSGKTTQIAQYLADGGFAKDGRGIAVSQPRRVGAMAAAKRVSEERGETLGDEVAALHCSSHVIGEVGGVHYTV